MKPRRCTQTSESCPFFSLIIDENVLPRKSFYRAILSRLCFQCVFNVQVLAGKHLNIERGQVFSCDWNTLTDFLIRVNYLDCKTSIN